MAEAAYQENGDVAETRFVWFGAPLAEVSTLGLGRQLHLGIDTFGLKQEAHVLHSCPNRRGLAATSRTAQEGPQYWIRLGNSGILHLLVGRRDTLSPR